MALKRLSNVAETAPVKSKDDQPVVKVSGRSVTRFVEATAAFKAAEATQKEERAKLLKLGLAELFKHNVENATSPVTTIKLIQENEVGEGEVAIDGDGNVVRLSFQERYSAADANTVDSLFTDLLVESNKDRPKNGKLTTNDFMQEVVAASFDSKIFLTGEKSEFTQSIFDAYLEGITKVTADLIKKGVLPVGTKVPLAVTKKVLPLATFHAERWSKFPTVVAQEQISEVVSNTVTLTPVAVAGTK
jgi:hypothetical protein